ncbi:MAG: hypothetical protein BIFFINMI_00014 [Phycisphaerae bacterium]|nr:hypothetical protein [Phycisphaerae bacterium]
MSQTPAQPDPTPRSRDATLLDWALGRLEQAERADIERAMAESPELRSRGQAIRRTLELLSRDRAPEPPPDLPARIRNAVADERRASSRLTRRESARPSIFSLAEVAAVAAALLLMALVFFPPVQKARTMAQQNACQDNLRRIGVAMAHYANANQNALPYLDMTGNWLDRQNGRQPTGTAPLFLLVKNGQIEPRFMVCPETEDKPYDGPTQGLEDFPDPTFCSYSFQNLFGGHGPMFRDSASRMPVLADRNPLFHADRFRQDASGRDNSPNHTGRGQNVLYNDGRVRWWTSPRVGVNSDNIWLAGDRSDYSGVETVATPEDTFLAP